jgi:hypothetical protein
MVHLRPSVAELRGAIAGATAIGLAYAAGRRYGLTRADIARTLAPDNPVAGRAAQLALGTLASRDGRGFSACAHALAAVVAQRVAAAR